MRFDFCFARFAVLAFLIAASGPVMATMCKCRQHNSEAESGGTCSRTEDRKYCTLRFTTTTPEEYRSFVERLSSLGVSDPRAALEFSRQRPPEVWTPQEMDTHLPALFAVSQRLHFQDYTADVAKAVGKSAASHEKARLHEAFRQKPPKVSEFTIGGFQAVVSYGCIELKRGEFSSMVKTRWSTADYFCHDLRRQ